MARENSVPSSLIGALTTVVPPPCWHHDRRRNWNSTSIRRETPYASAVGQDCYRSSDRHRLICRCALGLGLAFARLEGPAAGAGRGSAAEAGHPTVAARDAPA